jgi:putative ABC transport system ATP-binding protein
VSATAAVIEVVDVSKQYGDGDRAVWALRDVRLTVKPGELVSIVGPSGSGKSTLLNLIGGLDVPTSGEIRVNGRSLSKLSATQLARLRRESVTFIFQFFNLLPSLTAEQNVTVPLRAAKVSRDARLERTRKALQAVGMAHRGHHYPEQLSGGELQRLAIARALATDAAVILADEPTGNLDSLRGEEVLELLKRATEEQNRAVLLVTHDNRAAAYGDRIIVLRDGRLVDEVDTRPKADVLHLARDRK